MVHDRRSINCTISMAKPSAITCNQPWVPTKDIDLIKRIEIDEAHKHTDRAKAPWLIHEFNHSLMHMDGYEWRQVRQAIAPTMT